MESYLIVIIIVNYFQSSFGFNNCLESQNGLEYSGNHHQTKDGSYCEKWRSYKNIYSLKELKLSSYDYHYCRNPDNSTSPWCLFKKMKVFCFIPSCKSHPNTKICILEFPSRTQSKSGNCPRQMQQRIEVNLKSEFNKTYSAKLRKLNFCCNTPTSMINSKWEQLMQPNDCLIHLLPTTIDAANYSTCPPNYKQQPLKDTQMFIEKHLVLCCMVKKQNKLPVTPNFVNSINKHPIFAYYTKQNQNCGKINKIEYSWPKQYSLFEFMKNPLCVYIGIVNQSAPATNDIRKGPELLITTQDACQDNDSSSNLRTVFKTMSEFNRICDPFLSKFNNTLSVAEIIGDICYYSESKCKPEYREYSIFDWAMMRYVHTFCCKYQTKQILNLPGVPDLKFVTVLQKRKCPLIINLGIDYRLTVEHSIAFLRNTNNIKVDICIFKLKGTKRNFFQWFSSSSCPVNYEDIKKIVFESKSFIQIRDNLILASFIIRQAININISTCISQEKYKEFVILNSSNINKSLENLVCINSKIPGKCDISKMSSNASESCCVSYSRIVKIIKDRDGLDSSILQLNKALFGNYTNLTAIPTKKNSVVWIILCVIICLGLIALISVAMKKLKGRYYKHDEHQILEFNDTEMSSLYYKVDPTIEVSISEEPILSSPPENRIYEEIVDSVVYQDTV